MFKITVDIYENDTKVVRHVFYGKTKKQAQLFEQAHRITDKFYKAAVEDLPFRNLNLSYTVDINKT